MADGWVRAARNKAISSVRPVKSGVTGGSWYGLPLPESGLLESGLPGTEGVGPAGPSGAEISGLLRRPGAMPGEQVRVPPQDALMQQS